MTVDHNNLTDPELHEPKGAATAAANAVFIADGAGSGAFNSHSTFDDPDIHEPKDISTASINEVYMANGSGGGSWSPSVISEKFPALDQVITSGGTITLPHELDTAPIIIVVQLICIAAEGGYSIGDVVLHSTSSQSATTEGVQITIDTTNLFITYGSNATVFDILNKITGVSFDATNVNWKLRITAYA